MVYLRLIQLCIQGYREFCGYLESPSDASYAEALARMKISTWQYAKRQISWIRNKLIPAVNAANVKEILVPLYLMDATGSHYRYYYDCLTEPFLQF